MESDTNANNNLSNNGNKNVLSIYSKVTHFFVASIILNFISLIYSMTINVKDTNNLTNIVIHLHNQNIQNIMAYIVLFNVLVWYFATKDIEATTLEKKKKPVYVTVLTINVVLSNVILTNEENILKVKRICNTSFFIPLNTLNNYIL